MRPTAKTWAGPRTHVGEGDPEAPLMEFSPADLQGEVHLSHWRTRLCAREDSLKDSLLSLEDCSCRAESSRKQAAVDGFRTLAHTAFPSLLCVAPSTLQLYPLTQVELRLPCLLSQSTWLISPLWNVLYCTFFFTSLAHASDWFTNCMHMRACVHARV